MKTTTAALCVFALAACMNANSLIAQTSKLEGLLKQADIEYTKTSDGIYKVPLEVGDETLMIYMYPGTAYKGTKFESEYVGMYTRAVSLPNNYAPGVSFLTAMAQMNDYVLFGSCSLSEDKSSVLCNSMFWTKGATTEDVFQHLVVLYDMRRSARGLLLPYLSEE